jgi:WhiB family redox-sensing transcriptional regulator
MYEWMGRAVCRDLDPELFFPEYWDTRGAEMALSACRTCPVAIQCDRYRRQVGAYTGIWHGEWFRTPTVELADVRKEALAMSARGFQVNAIAAKLEVSQRTVQRWIGREKQRVSSPGARVLKRSTSLVIGGESD